MTDTTTTLYPILRQLVRAGADPDNIRRSGPGGAAWDLDWRNDDSLHSLDGWPTCECSGCGCDEPATMTDDADVPVCDECSDYALDDAGEVHCSREDDVEIVTESCGAGDQTRSYARMRPPEMPETDPDGEWALYWDTVGDDAHVVDRYATREDAETAVLAKDWPRPGDHTAYLCGYEARQLVDGAWLPLGEEV
jgi:hypothetical protein